MIELDRLTIKVGDTVVRSYTSGDLEPVPFIVDRLEIDASTMTQMVYPENGPPIPASEVQVVNKNDTDTIEDRNRVALEEILNSIYGDNWDILHAVGGIAAGNLNGLDCNNPNHQYVLVIHYPEFIIKNSKEENHTIRDLYVAIYLKYNYKINSGAVYGTRSTGTEAEYVSGYCHSHLSCNLYSRFAAFCTGGDMIDELRLMASSKNPSEDKLTYETFFETLNTFVQWESLEGGPFRRINGIRLSRYSNPAPRPEPDEVYDILHYLYFLGYVLPIDLSINSKRLIDFDFDTLKDSLKDFLISNINNIADIDPSTVFAIKEGTTSQSICDIPLSTLKEIINNPEDSDDENETYVEDQGQMNLIFRGQRVRNTIIKSKKSDLKKNSIDVNNNFVTSAIYNLKLKFYEQFCEREEEFIEELTNN